MSGREQPSLTDQLAQHASVLSSFPSELDSAANRQVCMHSWHLLRHKAILGSSAHSSLCR